MIEWLQHTSSAIKGFPMADPHERKVAVYLPPQYSSTNSDPYPVLFFLSGWGSRSWKYLSDDSAFSKPLSVVFDEEIAAKRMRPFIGVFPDGTSKLGCSQYINSSSLGHYQDYIADEIVDLVDSRFHTHRSPDFRGILGHSSGGYGALVAGAQRSDRFKFIGASAADCFFENLYGTSAVPTAIEQQRAGSIERFIADFFNHANPGSQNRHTMMALITLSGAPCYAPAPKNGPLFGELYFDVKTGTLIPEIFSKYLAWDPLHLFRWHRNQVEKLRYIYLDAGLDDEHGLQYGHRQLASLLDFFKIPFELDEFKGGHSGQSHRFPQRAQKLLDQMFIGRV
jgi:enterochelin esterase-like enzyme